MVIDDTSERSALKVAARAASAASWRRRRAPARPTLDTAAATAAGQDWQTLLGDGSVRRLTLTVGEVNDAFARAGHPEAAACRRRRTRTTPSSTSTSALATIPTVGRSLLGPAEYADARGAAAARRAGDPGRRRRASTRSRARATSAAASSTASSSSRTRPRCPLPRPQHRASARSRPPARPSCRDVDLFRIPADRLRPAQPWRLQLLVQRATGARDKAFISLDLPYSPPEKYLIKPPPPLPAQAPAAQPQPDVAAPGLASVGQPSERDELWRRIWQAKSVEIGVTAVAIGVLTLIFFFQDWLVRRQRLATWVRHGFLAFTLVWLGWYANAQLSVVNVLTFTNALLTGFSWAYLPDGPADLHPVVAVAAGLLFWGAGPSAAGCARSARSRSSPTTRASGSAAAGHVPWGLHERLWPIKYMIFLGLFGVSLYSLCLARAAGRGRAVQDGDHPALHPRLAVRALRGRPAGGGPVHRALLLPLPVPAGRGARHSRPDADVRLAEALARVRLALPALRQRLPGPGDPPGRPHQSQRMHLLHALPGALPR